MEYGQVKKEIGRAIKNIKYILNEEIHADISQEVYDELYENIEAIEMLVTYSSKWW